MDELECKQLETDNQALLDKRETLSLATDAPQKCKLSSKPPLPPSQVENTRAKGEKFSIEGWPPPHLAPVTLGSNLARWEAFNWDRHPKLRPAKRVIVDWYNDLPNLENRVLVLAGDVGCGKTHLVEAIYDLFGHWRASYYPESQLIKAIQETYGGEGSEAKIWTDIAKTQLFVFDDLGEYKTTNGDFLENFYNRIFNELLTLKKKTLLITTNMPMLGENGIEIRIGTRAFSRLCDALGKLSEGRYVDLFGITDFRLENYLDE